MGGFGGRRDEVWRALERLGFGRFDRVPACGLPAPTTRSSRCRWRTGCRRPGASGRRARRPTEPVAGRRSRPFVSRPRARGSPRRLGAGAVAAFAIAECRFGVRRALDRTTLFVGIARSLVNVDDRPHHPDVDVYAATNGPVALNKPLTTQHRRCSARSLPPAVPRGFAVGQAQPALSTIARRSSHAIT